MLLQREGFDVTVYAAATPDEQRSARLPNNVARFGPTQRREAELGVAFWPAQDYAMHCAHVRVRDGDRDPVAFRGDLFEPATFVDFRLYLPRLLEEVERRGATVKIGAVDATALDAIAARHDLVVVSTGRAGLSNVFERIVERSPYHEPQRRILAGYFNGVAQPDPIGLHFEVVAGCGEIFQTPVLTFSGPVTGLTFEAIPNGPWDSVVRADYTNGDPGRVIEPILALVRDYSPEIAARIDAAHFELVRPLDLLQGAIVPCVRRAWARLQSGAVVVAVGDALVVNDPLTGQGANLASCCAFELGRLILEAEHFDETFANRWEARAAVLTANTTEWTNSFLAGPEPHVQRLMERAQQHQPIADAFANNFADPTYMWDCIATPEAASRFAEQTMADSTTEAALYAQQHRFICALLNDDRGTLETLLLSGTPHIDAGLRFEPAAGVAGDPTLSGFHMIRRAKHLVIVSHALDRPAGPRSSNRIYCSTVWVRQPACWKVAFFHLSPVRMPNVS